MNLVRDVWVPIVRKDGVEEKIAIHQLLKEYKTNPVMEVLMPRPDFKSAFYQLLIGIVQVAFLPECEEDWIDRFEDSFSFSEFSEKVLEYEDCFAIDSKGCAFMQDFEQLEGEEKAVSTLLIEAPGENTIKNNKAHFIKSELVNQMDGYWAALALYTLQTFAPSGGSGHRVGLRGGGPLTTIIVPKKEATLWEKIWINVLSEEKISSIQGDISKDKKSDIFPWMKETKISNKKGKEILSLEVHPFYHFFGMPRRIRLNFLNEEGFCDISGVKSNKIVKSYIAKNLGNNYDGVWSHPLNAYRYDPKNPKEIPSSIKAQPGGIGYRHWLGLAVKSPNVLPAITVQTFYESYLRRDIAGKYGFRLWVAGFDMDNMKARCWYESAMPFYPLEPNEILIVQDFVSKIISETVEIVRCLKSSIKSAWTNRPKDVRGDLNFIGYSFWEVTEYEFYDLLSKLMSRLEDVEGRNELLELWCKFVKSKVENIFDEIVLAQKIEGLNMKRIMKARKAFGKGVGKFFNNMRKNKEEA